MMIGRLQEQARTAIDTRMRQSDCRATYELLADGLQFSVGKKGELDRHMFFNVRDDLRTITVSRWNRADEIRYQLVLDDDGVCKLRRDDDGEMLDPWQVLKAALEPLLFPS